MLINEILNRKLLTDYQRDEDRFYFGYAVTTALSGGKIVG